MWAVYLFGGVLGGMTVCFLALFVFAKLQSRFFPNVAGANKEKWREVATYSQNKIDTEFVLFDEVSTTKNGNSSEFASIFDFQPVVAVSPNSKLTNPTAETSESSLDFGQDNQTTAAANDVSDEQIASAVAKESKRTKVAKSVSESDSLTVKTDGSDSSGNNVNVDANRKQQEPEKQSAVDSQQQLTKEDPHASEENSDAADGKKKRQLKPKLKD